MARRFFAADELVVVRGEGFTPEPVDLAGLGLDADELEVEERCRFDGVWVRCGRAEESKSSSSPSSSGGVHAVGGSARQYSGD